MPLGRSAPPQEPGAATVLTWGEGLWCPCRSAQPWLLHLEGPSLIPAYPQCTEAGSCARGRRQGSRLAREGDACLLPRLPEAFPPAALACVLGQCPSPSPAVVVGCQSLYGLRVLTPAPPPPPYLPLEDCGQRPDGRQARGESQARPESRRPRRESSAFWTELRAAKMGGGSRGGLEGGNPT